MTRLSAAAYWDSIARDQEEAVKKEKAKGARKELEFDLFMTLKSYMKKYFLLDLAREDVSFSQQELLLEAKFEIDGVQFFARFEYTHGWGARYNLFCLRVKDKKSDRWHSISRAADLIDLGII